MVDRTDWSVPWPDGSWLTWNEETESWEKQDQPPAGAEAAEPEVTTAPAPKAAKPEATTPATTAVAAKEPAAKKAPSFKPFDKSSTTAPAPAPIKKIPAREPGTTTRANAVRRTVVPEATSTEHSWSWQPMADSPKKAPARTRQTSPLERPSAPPRRSFPESGRQELWPMVAAGMVAGGVAGYLLVFLVR